MPMIIVFQGKSILLILQLHTFFKLLTQFFTTFLLLFNFMMTVKMAVGLYPSAFCVTGVGPCLALLSLSRPLLFSSF